MRKLHRISIAVRRLTVLGVCYGMLGGCVVVDDIFLKNKFPFAVMLYWQYPTLKPTYTERYALVPAGGQTLLKGAAGRYGYRLGQMQILDEKGKVIGSLNSFILTEEEIKRGGCTGARSTWNITIGERTPAAATPPPKP